VAARSDRKSGEAASAGSFGTAHKGEVPVTLSISEAVLHDENSLLGARSVTIFREGVTRFARFVRASVETVFQN
jgi:hypothetical protein